MHAWLILLQTNTFQCILVGDGLNSFVIFLYADDMINWTMGSESDGIHAGVGFNAGDGIRFAVVPESQTSAIVDIETTSNVGVPGQWIFQVDGVNIATKCSSGPEGELSVPQWN